MQKISGLCEIKIIFSKKREISYDQNLFFILKFLGFEPYF
jgi:hypothetical protein